jgi:tRNA(Arg) A34 adenosine deaminase TadA
MNAAESTQPDPTFMNEAIELARKNIRDGRGGPFGTVIVKNGTILARGTNLVTSTNDPTAHAEIVAIREACLALGSFQLDGCEIYTSCEPCPMCLGAIYWARPKAVYFGNTRDDAAQAGFDDRFLYDELPRALTARRIRMIEFMRDEALVAFRDWEKKADKVRY